MNRITLTHIRIPMTEPFRISSGVVDTKDSIVVTVEKDGVMGFGEASPMAGGFYSDQTPETTWDFLTEIAVPKLIRQRDFQPSFPAGETDCPSTNPFAWAGLEAALWDLTLQEQDSSFPEAIGAQLHPVESGLAVGIYPTIDDLLSVCRKYLRDGYKRLKIKIEPGWDLEPLQAVRETFGDIPLMVDANAAYTEADFPLFDEIDRLGLLMIEQPLASADIEAHCLLQRRISTPICFDESASDISQVEKALRKNGCKIVNLKIQRLGGITNTLKMLRYCANHGISTWVGTMPELGIGALHALYVALLPNNCYPTDVEASSRWFEEDIIDPPIRVRKGLIDIPEQHRKRPAPDFSVIDNHTVRKWTVNF